MTPPRDAGRAIAGRWTVDLHLHTTASDGRLPPGDLVACAADAGVSVIAVTDHDTMAAVADVQAFGRERGLTVVPGIEITAVDDSRDVHMLGYFLDPADTGLRAFLAAQRATRIARVEAIGERLASLGMPIDVGPLVAEAQREAGRTLGRPRVARAMIDAGFVRDMREAFERWLGRGCPAFIERSGASPEEVIAIVHRAGGLVSLAHPGRTEIDDRIPALKEAGLDAIEAYHSDHDQRAVMRYAALARDLGVLVTGGSDFHGDPTHGVEPGGAGLPLDEWERLSAARVRHASR